MVQLQIVSSEGVVDTAYECPQCKHLLAAQWAPSFTGDMSTLAMPINRKRTLHFCLACWTLFRTDDIAFDRLTVHNINE